MVLFCCNMYHYQFYSYLKMIINYNLIFPTMSEEDAKVAERENFGSFVFWRVVWNSIKNLVCLDKETFIFLYLATYQTNFLYFWYCHQFISPKLLLLVDYIYCKNFDLFQDGLYLINWFYNKITFYEIMIS